MEYISQIPVFGGFLSTALAFVVVLGVVVFVHEYGHYIVARWCGIHAEKFSWVWACDLGTNRQARHAVATGCHSLGRVRQVSGRSRRGQ